MTPAAVLHVTSLLGGGVDRHVRDIARSVRGRHLFWHVGDGADVIELAGERRFHVIDPERFAREPRALERWLRAKGAGLVHVHSTSRAAERRARWAMEALALPAIATLHDVLFLRPDAFDVPPDAGPDAAWLARTSALLRSCSAVLAPSEFIAGLARAHVEGLDVRVVPNGSEAAGRSGTARAREDFEALRPRRVVGVLGAIGPHKGSALLDALALHLEGTDIGVVVIGFLERQLLPGWRVPGRLFVHGPWADEEVPALLAAYGVELALFPNRAPESFSYALSDVWSAGVPALAAPLGALAERISRHGGGWLLAPGFDAAAVAARLRELLSSNGLAELSRVKSQLVPPDPARTPPLETMARALEALYDRYGVDTHGAIDTGAPGIQELLATNLDGSLFRLELERLTNEVLDARRETAAAGAEMQRLRAFEVEAREWIGKLERDVAALKSELAAEVEARRSAGERAFALEGEAGELRLHKSAFDLLPAVVRKLLLKKILDARS